MPGGVVATYTFETITAAQAMAFNGQVDSLVFSNPASTGASTRVTFNPATSAGPATLSVLDVSDNHLVVFGVGLEGMRFPVYPNGSALGVESPGGGELFASSLGDGIFGIGGADTLHGLGGDDVLQGGQGADVLEGGAGSDLFLVAPGDSPAVAGQMDTVIDWSSADRLSFVFRVDKNFDQRCRAGIAACYFRDWHHLTHCLIIPLDFKSKASFLKSFQNFFRVSNAEFSQAAESRSILRLPALRAVGLEQQ